MYILLSTPKPISAVDCKYRYFGFLHLSSEFSASSQVWMPAREEKLALRMLSLKNVNGSGKAFQHSFWLYEKRWREKWFSQNFLYVVILERKPHISSFFYSLKLKEICSHSSLASSRRNLKGNILS